MYDRHGQDTSSNIINNSSCRPDLGTPRWATRFSEAKEREYTDNYVMKSHPVPPSDRQSTHKRVVRSFQKACGRSSTGHVIPCSIYPKYFYLEHMLAPRYSRPFDMSTQPSNVNNPESFTDHEYATALKDVRHYNIVFTKSVTLVPCSDALDIVRSTYSSLLSIEPKNLCASGIHTKEHDQSTNTW